ncbi:NnrS family protein [Azospirillum formosense]|uniref:NnrS family protein n=1 Tax=Azospirillum formosense TaxID=861533 RepID=A0ABX2L7K4_9PROT|nr:NnrS family protein [Azospirillum formosense]MBY3752672.1 NnrS family protein [Azospirillum formosense]NUB23114.1 NnrS family protein [Azospirillum formosense]
MSAFVPPPPQRPWGHRLFFPAAALYGALSVPLWVAGYFGWLGIGWTPALHAHEMLMGYALAVVGGFLLTRPSGMALAVAFAAWLAGRLAVLGGLPPEIAAPLALAYPVALFTIAGVPFLRAAKSGHNLLFGPVIGAFALAETLVWWGGDGGRTGALFALHLVGILMLVMGGRIIPSATAGELRKQGGALVERVQPRLEWAGVAGAVLAALTVAVGMTTGPLPWIGAAGAVLAGVTAWARLARWRTGAVLKRPDLWSLHLGYGWLGLGWLFLGVERLAPLTGGAGWHVIGAGALGTLAASMMVRATLQREALPPDFSRPATAAIALVGLAAALRVAAASTAPDLLMPAAALAWMGAHLLVLWVLLRVPKRIRA